MKKKKIDGMDIVIAILLFIIIILVVACIWVALNVKKKETNLPNNANTSTCECENAPTIVCIKKTDDGEFLYKINVDSTGEMKDYFVKHTNIYDENSYENIKEMRQSSDTVKFEFNDETHEIITTSFYNEGLLDGNGDPIHRWYQSFTKELEESGFACQEE